MNLQHPAPRFIKEVGDLVEQEYFSGKNCWVLLLLNPTYNFYSSLT
jgi:hypothetical protein